MKVTEFEVRVEEGQFYVRDPAVVAELDFGEGLLTAHDDCVTVLTGIDHGTVLVRTYAADLDPGPDTGPWEEIEEVRIRSTTGFLRIDAVEGCAEEAVGGNLATGRLPGKYRVRVHARGRGRGTGPDAIHTADTHTDNRERYLIQVWPAKKLPRG